MRGVASSGKPDASAPHVGPPIPKRVPQTLIIHGDARVDEYSWLRDSSDPDVAAYIEVENAYTQAAMADTQGLQTALYDEMLGHVKQTDLSAPYRRHGALYYTRTEAGKQYAVHCRRTGSMEAPEEVLLDLNELAQGKAFLGLGAFEVSDDGRRLAYSVDDTGYRQYALHVKDLVGGQTFAERIERVVSVVWASDNRTLLYGTEDAQTKRPDTVWRRELGDGNGELVQREAELVYHEADELFDVYVERSRDGAFVFIRSEAKDTTEYRYMEAVTPRGEARLFAARVDGVRYDLDHRLEQFYIRTNEGAPDFSLMTTPVARPDRPHWTVLVGQRPGMTITGVELFSGFIVVAGRRDGLASLELLVGSSRTPVPLTFDEADYFVRVGQNAEYDTATFRFNYESLVTPPAVYDLDVVSGVRTLVKALEVPGYDPSAYRAERLFLAVADGTRIPVSVVRRRPQNDAPTPLLLYGYGSYGISIDATFSAARLPLLDRGVAFAIAHIRGGGEYGEAWRLAGNLFSKRTTFTDFIDCATGLVDAGYTSPEQLVIQGASAGGLLMGAVVNMRPELFRAAIVQVPFVDVLTTMLDATLPLTTGEYREWGDPNDAGSYAYMRTYSPIDNVFAQPYPALLIEVAYYDSQVPYWEGMKFAAKVRDFTTSANPVLVKVNMGAGHGGASGRYDALKERAFDYAFVLSSVEHADLQNIVER